MGPAALRSRTRRLLVLWCPPALLLALVFGQLTLLRELDYSQAWLSDVSTAEATAPPDPLALGGLRWDPHPYVQASSLDPFRAMVSERCPGRAAFDTATCLSDFFSVRFPHGAPGQEFFQRSYAPAAELAIRLAGRPGHCVTRSGLLATALLAAGFPARVAQLVPGQGELGHNVVEVWDQTDGWRLVDPTFGVSLAGTSRALALTAALAAPSTATLRRFTAVDAVMRTSFSEFYARGRAGMFSGNMVYPDPWLYTRVGKASAPRPFQGRFVIVGPRSWELGIGQPLLVVGIVLSALGLALSLLRLIFGVVSVRKRRALIASIVDPALN